MAVVSLALAKLHLRVDQSVEDTLIAQYIASAEASIEGFLNRPIPNKNLPTPNIPAPIVSAALIMIADLYENRQTDLTTGGGTAYNLLQPYRVKMGI